MLAVLAERENGRVELDAVVASQCAQHVEHRAFPVRSGTVGKDEHLLLDVPGE